MAGYLLAVCSRGSACLVQVSVCACVMPVDGFTGEPEPLPEVNALAFLDPFPAIAGATAEVRALVSLAA